MVSSQRFNDMQMDRDKLSHISLGELVSFRYGLYSSKKGGCCFHFINSKCSERNISVLYLIELEF